jgi:asparagine N-glycosylation enzyme membrane subunit Stt3
MFSKSSSFGRLVMVLAIIAVFAFWSRNVMRSTLELPDQQRWAVSDPDSLYHLRRIQLWMDGGSIGEGIDPWLNHPHGARVPWPPYYTVAARIMMGPGAPDDAWERTHWIERRAAHLPIFFGVLTSLLAAIGAWIILRPTSSPKNSDDVDLRTPGAMAAGLLHAFCNASIYYSSIGNADHHAFVSCLNGAMMVSLVWVMKSGVLRRSEKRWGFTSSTRWGALIGMFAGILLGAWVGSLMYVITFQLALAALLFFHARKPMTGLPAFGLSFHLAAMLILLPAVICSPWLEENPWMVVNLSWFHPLFLLCGAGVFVPLLSLSKDPSKSVFRRYPWIVGSVLAGLALILSVVPNPIEDGVREGYSWLSTTEEFMTNVAESRPLIGDGAESGVLTQYLGYGIFLLPIAWLLVALSMLRQRKMLAASPSLSAIAPLPLIIAIPFLALPALSQRRFGDALAMPMAVILSLGLVFSLSPLLVPLQRKVAKAVPKKFNGFAMTPGLFVWIFLAIVLQWPAVHATHQVSNGRRPGPKLQAKIAAPQGMYSWLREHRDESNPTGVLSNWGQGHAITWAAQLPSVACNFGSYVGIDSFQAPSRFFLAEDNFNATPADTISFGEQLLLDRKVEWVIVPWQLPGMLRHQVAAIHEKPLDYYLDSSRDNLKAAWYQTIGAQLMFDGRPAGSMSENSVPFMRLVHESPIRMQKSNLGGINRRVPAGWIWQYVQGAELQARGQSGDRLQVSVQIRYPSRDQPLIWEGSTIVGEDGVARVRVPYCTDQKNGDGSSNPTAQWKFSGESGSITIPESAVLSGAVLEIQ